MEKYPIIDRSDALVHTIKSENNGITNSGKPYCGKVSKLQDQCTDKNTLENFY